MKLSSQPLHAVNSKLSKHHVVDLSLCFFFLNAAAATETYTLSLHDALPILPPPCRRRRRGPRPAPARARRARAGAGRSEEHTSELQSHSDLVCRLLLEKKKNISTNRNNVNSDVDGSIHLNPMKKPTITSINT